MQQEVCTGKTFTASCRTNEVLVVNWALYGRMEICQCVDSDLGYLGCQADALHLVDTWCSGRKSCDKIIPNEELDAINNCLKELRTYMKVEYECVRGRYNILLPELRQLTAKCYICPSCRRYMWHAIDVNHAIAIINKK